MIPGYRIRNIDVSPGLVLSPMSGVTCSPFRRLLKELNPGAIGLVISEFVSVEGMTRGSKRSLEMMRFEESERPYGVQIFGYDPERMRTAAIMVQELGADLVDINCGCPAPKVVRRGGGCELMRQPEHLRKIVVAVKGAVTIPVTMKIRSGWDSSSINALEVARIAQGEGIEALAIHGRTRADLYRGTADWELVAQVVADLKIPVAGSGDVVDLDSAQERLQSGVSGLYIGRAAISNPLIFTEIVNRQSYGLRFDAEAQIRIVRRYLELLRESVAVDPSSRGISSPERFISGKLKQLVSQMCRGQQWQKQFLRARTFEEQHAILC